MNKSVNFKRLIMFKYIVIIMIILNVFTEISFLQAAENPSEFEFSEAEKTDIKKLIDKSKSESAESMNHIINEAFKGNPVAMYFSGYCNMWGHGTTINKQSGKMFYKMAASLGYAPALYEIFSQYCTESDPLLAMVYLNLTIGLGHKEYSNLYEELSEQIKDLGGKFVIQEIEMIALNKLIQIQETRIQQDNLKDTFMPGLKLMGTHSLTFEDAKYNAEYWRPFFDSEEEWKFFFEK